MRDLLIALPHIIIAALIFAAVWPSKVKGPEQ